MRECVSVSEYVMYVCIGSQQGKRYANVIYAKIEFAYAESLYAVGWIDEEWEYLSVINLNNNDGNYALKITIAFVLCFDYADN